MRFSVTSACLFSLYISNAQSAAGPPSEFDWSAVTPSSQLQYHKCYDGFECARLVVPRDWLDVEKNKTVAIAIIKLPASVPSSDPSFGGSIITNPGGPGGSGVYFLRKQGKNLQKITEGKKHYEIISFDPRGIENTTPKTDCFGKSHALARDAMLLEQRGIGGLDSSESGLKRALALKVGYGSLCEGADSEDDIFEFVSTASVARDILEIADRTEQLRQADDTKMVQDDLQSPLHQRVEPKPPRVLYWGFSYGTILGNTLASLYPGRMGRVILDGVVDSHDYMSGSWLRNLMDTEKIVQYFYATCFEASGECPLWREGDTSAKDIQSRIEKLITDLDEKPVSFIADDQKASIRVLTGVDIRTAFREPLYAPLPTGFQHLAIALAEALNGNYSLIGPNNYPSIPLQDVCGLDRYSPGDAQAAIACGDARFYNPEDHPKGANLTYWGDYVTKLEHQSPTFAPFWATVGSACAGWGIVAKWGYKGPWTTPSADPSLKDDAPAAPILFTSSRLDPVTPLENAYKMSANHPNSSVLVLDTVGHCASGNGWSECFNEAIRAYLENGTLPENGTMCADTTCRPFVKGGECRPPESLYSAGVDGYGIAQRNWGRQPLGFPLGFP
ncbi:hypothetical protein N0V93_002709 [Gnomoniopsis smithogilvyi]|uniref:Peptidase S33 tripeptidyl aminopeptidase-like C-terminal domain-containing protein n=1 Tax=Gnomoniopsis smithogilvyi TaxID=1191159 RepID=A0A9W8YVT1_9PEZI|nr:hypothetical protein N0V93_002709 [Gnomoniopsis smithogilvyi]